MKYSSRTEALALEIKPEAEIQIFLHPPGDEFWLHQDYWQEYPVTSNIGKDIFIYDVVVSKIIASNGDEDCNDDEDYEEIGEPNN